MQLKLCSPILLALIATISLLGMGCGKKEKEATPLKPHITPIIPGEVEAYMEKQELICGGVGVVCPSYLAKIVILEKDGFRFCTGFLTDSYTLATSSSCLPEYMRVEGRVCHGEIFIFFFNGTKKPIRANCKQILKVSYLDSEDPLLWRNDVSFLELEERIPREPLFISRAGLADNQKVTVWSIDQTDEIYGIIRQHECRAIHNSYFNPLVTDKASPNMILSGCPFVNGNSGSPIISNDTLRGTVSRAVSKGDFEAISASRELGEKLKPAVHATNYACAPTVYQIGIPTENKDECKKVLSPRLIDESRGVLNSGLSQLVQKHEKFINDPIRNPYLKLAVKLKTETDGLTHKAEIYPECFKNYSEWINLQLGNDGPIGDQKFFGYQIKMPEMIFKRWIDSAGRYLNEEIVQREFIKKIEFYPRSLRSSRAASTVFLWEDGQAADRFPSVHRACPSLF